MSRKEKAKLVSIALKEIAANDSRLGHNEWRIIVALERAVARLEQHEQLREHLVFKGGFVLLKTTDTTRFTKDVDALAVSIHRENVPALVQSALAKDLDDGLWYGNAETKDLEEQGLYGAYRFVVPFQIGDPPADPKINNPSDGVLVENRCHGNGCLGSFLMKNWRGFQSRTFSCSESYQIVFQVWK